MQSLLPPRKINQLIAELQQGHSGKIEALTIEEQHHYKEVLESKYTNSEFRPYAKRHNEDGSISVISQCDEPLSSTDKLFSYFN